MSLHPRSCYTVPEETARVARAVFPHGNIYLRLYESMGGMFQVKDFAAMIPPDGQPALSPMRLVLVLILQFAARLSDREAADAVRSRIDCPQDLREVPALSGTHGPRIRL